jgi:hypothetical protein
MQLNNHDFIHNYLYPKAPGIASGGSTIALRTTVIGADLTMEEEG